MLHRYDATCAMLIAILFVSVQAAAAPAVEVDIAPVQVAQATAPSAGSKSRAPASGGVSDARPATPATAQDARSVETVPARQARDDYKLRPACSKLVSDMASIVAGLKAHSSLASGHEAQPSAHLWAAQVLTQHADGRSYALLVAAPRANSDQCEGAYANVFYVPQQCGVLVRSSEYMRWTFEEVQSTQSGAIILSFPSAADAPASGVGDRAPKRIPMPTAHLINAGSGCMVILAETVLDRGG